MANENVHEAVQLSEDSGMVALVAAPQERDGYISAVAPLDSGNIGLMDVAEKLRLWVESPLTKHQVPVSALFVCDLLIEKNEKYQDAWKKFGIYSVIIDIAQKLSRLQSMTFDHSKSEWKMSAAEILSDIENEGSVFDTIRDIAGYSILALAMFEGASEERLRRARNMLKRLAA